MTHTPDENSMFTPHLNLEKAPNGSFEDTWDTLINDNLDLIDAGVLASSRTGTEIVVGTAGQALALHDVVLLSSVGTWYKAASDFNGMANGVKAICMQALDKDATGDFLLRGRVTSSRFSSFATPGMLVSVSPTTPGDVGHNHDDRLKNIVGLSLGNNEILFYPPVEEEGHIYNSPLILAWEYAGEAIAVNDVVRYDPYENGWYKAQADTLEHCSGAIGIAVTAAAAPSADIQIMVHGYLERGPSVSDTTSIVYISATTAGALTTTPPPIRRAVGFSNVFYKLTVHPSNAPEMPVAFAPISADAVITGQHPRVVLADTTAEDIAITLPAASTCTGQTFILKKSAPSATTYGCQFARAGTDTIDGATTTPLITAQYGTVRVISDGTSWWII